MAVLALGYQGGVKAFQTFAKTYGVVVPDEQADVIVKAWRAGHPKIVNFWRSMEQTARMAMANPGKSFSWGPCLKWGVANNFLHCLLPSRRMLSYNQPELRNTPVPWDPRETRRAITFMGMDAFSHQWKRQQTYGGKLVENIVQAVSRDLMAEAMLRIEKAGYPVVLSVHDELVSEIPEGYGSLEEYEFLMAESPEWSEGLPIAAEGWRGKRYRKV